MKVLFFPALAVLSLTAHAAVPKQPTLTAYTKLWTDSPFTAKPPPVTEEPAVNPFEGYSLGGVSRVQGGYFVLVLDANDPEKKISILPGVKSDWEVLKVNWSDKFWKETTVEVMHGGVVGELAFEEEQLVLAPPPKPVVPNNPNQANPGGAAPGNQPGQGNRQGGNQWRPRQRVAPPQGGAPNAGAQAPPGMPQGNQQTQGGGWRGRGGDRGQRGGGMRGQRGGTQGPQGQQNSRWRR